MGTWVTGWDGGRDLGSGDWARERAWGTAVGGVSSTQVRGWVAVKRHTAGRGGVHTWVAVQGLRVLTAAPSEASWTDAHVAAAVRVMALAPILQSSPRSHAMASLPLPPSHRGQPWLRAARQYVGVGPPGRAGPGRWGSGRCHVL
jgi:hypothetical protein